MPTGYRKLGYAVAARGGPSKVVASLIRGGKVGGYMKAVSSRV